MTVGNDPPRHPGQFRSNHFGTTYRVSLQVFSSDPIEGYSEENLHAAPQIPNYFVGPLG
jgi:hypothetical protein